MIDKARAMPGRTPLFATAVACSTARQRRWTPTIPFRSSAPFCPFRPIANSPDQPYRATPKIFNPGTIAREPTHRTHLVTIRTHREPRSLIEHPCKHLTRYTLFTNPGITHMLCLVLETGYNHAIDQLRPSNDLCRTYRKMS